ncbi:DUF222 domain-containing protein [Arthrobacter sp. SAFR-014]|uniref:DUF222 domain-containing protein n=1 Tax=Arthrobacter sp. SAFR-014 TaxID=3387280 RepID=UPI003F7BFB49
MELLRDRLRISSAEARRRIGLADAVLPRTGFGGQQLPPRYEELAAAVDTAQISSRAATTITLAMDRARHFTTPDHTAAMEHDLTLAAVENDADFLTRVATNTGPRRSTRTEPNPPKRPSAKSRAPSSAAPNTACSTWKSSPPPNSSKPSPPS